MTQTNQKVSRFVIAILAFVPLLLNTPAFSSDKVSSVYEKFRFKDCKILDKDERSEIVSCAFTKGPDLVFVLGEHGVSTMLEAPRTGGYYAGDYPNFKMGQTGHFGFFAEDAQKRHTIEWRVKSVAGKWQPFAMIIRSTYQQAKDDGSWVSKNRLDVLKWGKDHACQLGSVEGDIADHNVKARTMADAAIGKNPCPSMK